VFLSIFLVGAVIAGCVAYHATKPARTSAELDLCRRFMTLKNAGDPGTTDLLGPAPVVPADPLRPEEADLLHAEFFLRDQYRIVSVRPENKEIEGPDARFVLVVNGTVTSPRIAQIGPKGTDIINRSMFEPEIVVRVQDGKIHAVAARKQHEEKEKPMSKDEQRRVREAMEEQQRRLHDFYQGTQKSGGNR